MDNSNNKKIQELILKKLDSIENEVKDIRQTDIPRIKVEMAVMKSEAKVSAKVVAGAVSIVTLVVSTVIAWIK